MTTTEISNSADILDVRDIIERFEELESELESVTEDSEQENQNTEIKEELEKLRELLDDMKGYGGDHQWRGDWYPVTLIRDSYFEEYAEELAEDIGAIQKGMNWPYTCIDWEKAAKELQMDYSSVDFDGETYWYR